MQKKSTLRRLTQEKAFPLLIIVILLALFAMVFSSGVLKGAPISALFNTGFMSDINLLTLFYKMVIQIFMVTGLTCILISGNIDLSIAAQATLAALIFAKLCMITTLPWGIIFIIALLFGCVFGLVNTVLVNIFKFPAFIATIGASSVYGGLCNIVSNGNSISISRPSFIQFAAIKVGVFPITFIIAIVVLIIFQFMLSKTRFGRSLYMAGGNPIAARLSGLNPDKLRMILFLINSLMSVIGGLFYVAQSGTADPTGIIGSAPNMTATAAAILGGVAFFGGAGNLVGPLIGLFLIDTLESVLNILEVNKYWVVVAQGVLLLVALVLDYISSERRRKAMIAAAANA